MKRKKKRGLQDTSRMFYLFISPWIIGFCAFTLFPMLFSLATSFTDWSGLGMPTKFGLDNYIQIFTADKSFWTALKNTLFYVGVSVPLNMVVALILAILLNKRLPGSNFFRAVFYLPTICTGVALYIAWMYLFNGDSRATFAISHPEQNGAVTTGTEQWKDYSVKSSLKPSIHRRFGLIGRARGHRRYYGLVLWDQKFAGIICKKGSWEICLAKVPFIYEENVSYDMELTMKGNRITGRIGQVTLEAEDETYSCGGAGFLVDEGTALAYGFTVEERQQEIKNRTEGTDR